MQGAGRKDQAAADTKEMENEKAANAGAADARSQQKATRKSPQRSRRLEGSACYDQASCVQVAADHATTIAARKEELTVIAHAHKILQDTSSGAV